MASVVESPAAAAARALAADPAAIREAYARDLRHDGGDRPAKDTAEPSCGGVSGLALPEASTSSSSRSATGLGASGSRVVWHEAQLSTAR